MFWVLTSDNVPLETRSLILSMKKNIPKKPGKEAEALCYVKFTHNVIVVGIWSLHSICYVVDAHTHKPCIDITTVITFITLIIIIVTIIAITKIILYVLISGGFVVAKVDNDKRQCCLGVM